MEMELVWKEIVAMQLGRGEVGKIKSAYLSRGPRCVCESADSRA